MTQSIKIIKDNLYQIDFGSIVVFSYTEAGLMSEAGKIEFSTADGTLYHLNYLSGDVTLDEFCRAYTSAPVHNMPIALTDWQYFGLGAGNHLMIHNKAYEKIQRELKNPDDDMQICRWWQTTKGMPILSEQERYEWLVEKARESYPFVDNDSKVRFEWCNDCENEINLWTLWQGKGCLKPEILLVGQDWGNPFSGIGKEVLRNIKQGCLCSENDRFDTDKNLAKLFDRVFDLNIWKKTTSLFFTNLFLGYRTGKNGGNFRESYLNRDLIYFKELVNILQPKVVICLGRDTFTYALKAYGNKKAIPKNYNTALNDMENKEDINGIRFFGMAHCGNLGCLNRIGNRKGLNVGQGLERQIKDWEQIKSYLKSKDFLKLIV